MLIDFRTVSNKQNERIIKRIKKMLINTASTIEIINNISPFSNKGEKITMSDFITEASFISSKKRHILGVGPVTAHKKDEFITIESLKKLEEQYIKIIKEKCK